MARVFLTAQWRDLIIASYAIDRSLLEPLLPEGLELDLFQGQPVCSLVGFLFLDTRVLGVKWPGLVNFPEINLRFYVRDPESGQRGVVFVRELVRSRLVALVARTLYNEPYFKGSISEEIVDLNETRRIGYQFRIGHGTGSMQVEVDSASVVPPEDSTEHWFKEHQWGFGRTRSGRTLRYEVRHPVWACHAVRSSVIEVDWARVYGEQWAALGEVKPISTVLAAGSEIEVRGAEKLGA